MSICIFGFSLTCIQSPSGIDVGCAELIASGKVALRQGVEPVSFTETSVMFNDGSELQADVVIFAYV